MDRKAFRKLSYGLFLITAADCGGRKVGCVVNTFQQVASDPVMASVSLHKDNATTEAVRSCGRFGVTVLSQSADMQLIGTFGFKSSRDIDKFAEVQHAVDDRQMAYITEHSNARFCVKVMHQLDLGSHILFVGVVEDAAVLGDEPSMTYDYYHSELRGKAPKNAVSYEGGTDAAAPQPAAAAEPVAEAAAEAEAASAGARYGWRCLICGFVIETDELPDDFVCPVCGVGKDMFERFLLD